jgi:hypothetical protein
MSAWWPRSLLPCLYLSLQALAAAGQAHIPIELRVEGHQTVLAEAGSYFSRELRSIPDVDIVGVQGDWELLVLAAEMRGTEGTIGIIVAATLLEIVDEDDLAAIGAEPNTDLPRFVHEERLRRYENMWVYHGGPYDMPVLARQIVAEIDMSILEAHRRRAPAGGSH